MTAPQASAQASAPNTNITRTTRLFIASTIERVRRIGTVRNRSWELTVAPAGDADVTLTLRSTASCTDAHAVCTADGRTLEGGVQMVIAGPAVLSVADASVDEAAGATLDFVVTLSKQRFSATTVDYATSDGTASEPGDYTATSGTLTFAALETTKTISVPVRDDAHDDGGETLTLTLSNASGARLGDAEATGTINNSDSMPKGWMTRFGRTIGGQVVDALGQRFAGANTSHVTLGGPTSGTSPRARRVLAVLPGPCRGSPLNNSKNSVVILSTAMITSADGSSVLRSSPLRTAVGNRP